MSPTNKLENKLILIIGGTSGIGFGVAKACVEYGASVVVAGRSQQKVDSAIERLRPAVDDLSKVRGHVCDLSGHDVETNVQKLFDFATNNGQVKVHHVVSTAGQMSSPLALKDTTAQDILNICQARIVGDVIIAKLSLQYLDASHTSSYTLTGGLGTYKPVPGYSVRDGLGGAKDALIRSLALEMKPIRVNLVNPGAVQTEMFDQVVGMWGERAVREIADKVVLGRVGQPEDLAEAYLGVMKNYFITGSIIDVDGGAQIV
ncbi:hypothetical protein FOMA001_g17853 [Fusarium oxysporum f. sp. matthiolae]|nr:hypothetical protein FOMA001_g17853 [Fusarium oxysporum f. sp. matthiolae]